MSVLPPPPAPLVLGVSGGGDSMALLHMAHEAGFRCHAVTVDHGLRAEAKDEAAFVARVCRGLGVSHTIRRAHGQPETGMSAWARAMRFALVPHEVGTVVALAHNSDDQAETLRMRAQRGGGTLGLSGIPPVMHTPRSAHQELRRHYDGHRFVRPLLHRSRIELRDWLRERGHEWIDDPSNADETYERNRLRSRPSRLEPTLVARLATLSQRHRSIMMHRIASAFEKDLDIDRCGLWTLRTQRLPEASLRLLALRIVIASAGGSERLPSEPTLTRLCRNDAFTFAHTCVRRIDGGFRVWREDRDLPSRTRGVERDPWDGRFVSAGGMSYVEPLGDEGIALLEEKVGTRFTGDAGAALRTQPMVHDGNELLSVPGFDFGGPRLRRYHAWLDGPVPQSDWRVERALRRL